MEREIVRYSYVMIIALLVSSVFNYFYQVLMGAMLPKNEFGILGVSLSIFFIASVLTNNTFSWSGTRRMSLSEEIPEVLRTTILGNFTLAFLASLLIIYFSFKSENYFVPNMFVVAALLLTAFVNSYGSLLRARKMFKQVAGANIMSNSLKLISAVVLVTLGFGAAGAIFALVIAFAVALLYLLYYVSRLDIPSPNSIVKDMIPETFLVSVIFLGIVFIVNSSIIFMRFFGGSDLLAGEYNAALTIARFPFFITAAFIMVLFPYTSSTFNEREYYGFQSLKYVFIFVIPVCISMTANPEIWLKLFFGQKYESFEILRLLSVGIGFMSITFLISSNLVAFEELKFPALTLSLAAASLILVFIQDADLMFISALSVVLSSIFAALPLFVYYTRKFYFKGSLSYLLRLCIAYVVLALTLQIHPDSRIFSLFEILLSFGVYFIVLSVLNLFDEEDVSVIFSPFPLNGTIKKIVGKLNGFGNFLTKI